MISLLNPIKDSWKELINDDSPQNLFWLSLDFTYHLLKLILIVTLILLIIVLVPFGLYSYITSENSRSSFSRPSVKLGIDETNRWKFFMNETQNPCNDFFNYTCGTRSFDPFYDEQNDINLKCLAEALNEDFVTSSSAIQKMRQFQTNEKQEKHPISIEELIEEMKSFGGCPLIDPNWKQENFNVTSSLQKIAKLTGKLFLFDTVIVNDESADNMLQIEFYSRHPDWFIKEDLVNYYQKQIFDNLKFMTSTLNSTNQQKDKNHLNITVQQIFNLGWGRANLKNSRSKEDIKFDQLDKMLPYFGGKNLFMNNVLILPEVKEYLTTNPTIRITNQDILLKQHDFYKKLDKNVLANYLCYCFIEFNTNTEDDYLTTSHYYRSNEYHQLNSKPVKYLPIFSPVANYLFAKNCASEKIRYAKEIYGHVKSSAKQILFNSNWLLDEKSREKAILKLDSMKNVIGAPKISMNFTLLDEYYALLKYSPNDTIRQLKIKNEIFKNQQNFYRMTNLELMPTYSNVFLNNAFYYSEYNAIYIPTGRLISPNLNLNMPDVFNFATLGYTIGHEIFHAFDIILRDENGKNTTWLSEKAQVDYVNSTKCLISQFDNIKDQETQLHLNGTKTAGENFADLLGLQAAFHAYQLNAKKEYIKGYEKYGPDQAFFISYGMQFCGLPSTYSKRGLIHNNVHAPNEYRVNEVLKNFPEFANAFNCPLGSVMNPRKRCEF